MQNFGGSSDPKCGAGVLRFSKHPVPPSKIQGTRRVIKDPQILGANEQNFAAKATWRLGFVHPWL